jgi:hypothetical protein
MIDFQTSSKSIKLHIHGFISTRAICLSTSPALKTQMIAGIRQPSSVNPDSDLKRFFELPHLLQATIRAKSNAIVFLSSYPFYPYQEHTKR